MSKSHKMKYKKTCPKCIDKPNIFSGAIMSLENCFKYGWHVHKTDEGYVVFKKEPE